MNEGQSEEWSYSRNVDRAEPQRVRRNKPGEEVERNRCNYKDFMDSKLPSFFASPILVDVIDWIS